MRGLFAMRCDARGLVAFARCAVMHGMRRPMRCAVVVRDAMRGLVAFARCSCKRRQPHAFDGGILRVLRNGFRDGRRNGRRNGWVDGMGGWCDGFKGWFH